MKEALFWTSVLVLIYSIDSTSISKEIADFSDGCVPPPLKDFLPSLEGLMQTQKFCQEENSKTQYINSYAKGLKMSLFSAAIVEAYTEDRGQRPDWTQGVKGLPDWRPRNKHYAPFDDFDKGHLFPFSYSKNAAQAKSTMRLTNAVPQDKVFNQQVWSTAERHLKEKFIDKCNKKKGHKSIVVTGAVPAYFGVGETLPGYHMRIGVNDKFRNSASVDPLPRTNWKESGPLLHEALSQGLTVPTHLWTYFACITTTREVIDQTSYIGLNYRTGVIKWYNKFADFARTLKKMYHLNQLEIFNGVLLKKMTQDSSVKGPDYPKFCKPGESLNFHSMKCLHRDQVGEDRFWDNANIHDIRGRNEQRRLNFLLTLYGQRFEESEGHYVFFQAVTSGDDGIPRQRPRKRGSRRERGGGSPGPKTPKRMRRKRSANQEEEEEEEPNIKTLGTIGIINQDPDRDFELSSCEFFEKNTTGQVQETHTYDFQRNVLIEDRNPGGSVLSAKYFVNGTETEAEEETSNHQEIKIVLSPRYAPTSPTTSTTTTTTTSTTTQTPTTTTASTTTTTPTTTTTLTTTTTSTTTTTQTTTTTPTTTTTLN